MIRRNRGFRIGRRLVRVFKWMTRLRMTRNPTRKGVSGPGSKIRRLGRFLSSRAKRLCSFGSAGRRRYFRFGEESLNPVGNDVPKGHLAVYVGQSGDDTCRVLVPVIYFNHPLFGELLKEAEKVYGYDHPGGITLPCAASELEKVRARIVEGGWCRRRDGRSVVRRR